MKTRRIRSHKRASAVIALLFSVTLFGSLTGFPRLKAAEAFEASSEINHSDTDTYDAHYIVFEKQPNGSIVPRYHKVVSLSGPLPTMDQAALTEKRFQTLRNCENIEVLLQSITGETIFRNMSCIPKWTRGEFHGSTPNSMIDGSFFPIESPAFVIRVPAIEKATLSIHDQFAVKMGEFSLDRLILTTPGMAQFESQMSQISTTITGDSANRVDLLIMGDGYTSAEQAKFTSDATSFLADFFGISPYSEYVNFANTHMLFTASPESGADHPPYQAGCTGRSCCGDTKMLSDPLQGTFANTAFNARFCAQNIHRLLLADSLPVFAAASAVPEWDEILLLVNDGTYGGSGGSIAVASTHNNAVQIAQHEYGHSFVDLADEYESPFPGYPTCSDISGPSPCEVNVTDVVTRALIKWFPWIDPSTPIPTEPEFDPIYNNVVGLFKGARYRGSVMHRSGQSCIMRILGAPYCQVPSQAYVLKLYDGGWGVPASGIDLIEPGSLSPATDSVILASPNSQVFQASLLQPSGGTPISIQWFVDGVLDPTHTQSFTYTPGPSTVGDVEIRLLVQDTTPLVHPTMAGTALQSSHVWTVEVLEAKHTYLPLVSNGD